MRVFIYDKGLDRTFEMSEFSSWSKNYELLGVAEKVTKILDSYLVADYLKDNLKVYISEDEYVTYRVSLELGARAGSSVALCRCIHQREIMERKIRMVVTNLLTIQKES